MQRDKKFQGVNRGEMGKSFVDTCRMLMTKSIGYKWGLSTDDEMTQIGGDADYQRIVFDGRLNSEYHVCMYVCMVTHIARVWINRVRLRVLHEVS